MMLSTKYLLLIFLTSCLEIHIIQGLQKQEITNRDYINCSNFTQVKKPFDLILEDDVNIDLNPQSFDTILRNLQLNSEMIRYSLCQIKSSLEEDIHLAELEADTFNNDHLEQLDGTVTSRRVGSALRHTVLKVGECVSNVAKQVLILPIRMKTDVPCVTSELMILKNYSTDVANVITEVLKTIVHYPRQMAMCFKTGEKIKCLSKLHKSVIKNVITYIRGIVNKSMNTDKVLMMMKAKENKCPDYTKIKSKLALIPLKLTNCINNKIY